MNKKKIKRIIAKEGLILVGLVGLCRLYLYRVEINCTGNLTCWGYYSKSALKGVVSLYVFYLLIRFIIWAIRTLKER